MGRRALICGVSGQDGSYLAKLLLSKGYEVWGSSRDAELNSFHNLRLLGIFDAVQRVSLNPIDIGSILGLLRRVRPDEVFSLSGQSSVGLSFEQPVETIQSIALATLNLLEGIRLSDSNIRFYNAGSTECFGDTGNEVANERSQFNPRSPYAVAKASAYWTVANYREAYGMFVCTGILSNHDSPLRPLRFVTRKIIHAVASLALGKDAKLVLGNFDVERDWGWAPEYVQAISRMLEQSAPKDYIIATGQSRTLTQFVETAFNLIGKDWREYVTIDQHLVRPTDIARNKVDPSKAAAELGWKAQHHMKDVISLMLDAEIASLRGGEDNEIHLFPKLRSR
jgi:GDPmannose 4,6-dehydratase